jgi:cytochrome b
MMCQRRARGGARTLAHASALDYPFVFSAAADHIMSSPTHDAPAQIRVWDAPIRVFHWLLASAFATAWWTAENGQLQYHRYSGYLLIGLLVFRIYWGFAGSTSARFGSFLRSPASALRYLTMALRRPTQRSAAHSIGHNPAGGWSVLAMLVLLLTQVVLGLFAVDVDGLESGPLSYLVSFEVGRSCAQWHGTVFNVLQVLIALHVAAVLFYLWYRRDNLITPMIFGTRRHAGEHVGARVQSAAGTPWRIVVGVLLASTAVWLIAR